MLLVPGQPVGCFLTNPSPAESTSYENLIESPELIPILQTFKIGEIPQKKLDIFQTLSKNIIELAPFIFESNPTVLGTRCFLGIMNGNLPMIDALLDQSLIQQYAIAILNTNEFQPLSLTRLAAVTQISIFSRPERLLKCCGFIFQFLNYIDQYAVLYFFSSVFNEKMELHPFQRWLIASKLPFLISNQISQTEIDDHRLSYLFRLVIESKKSSILFPHFACDQIISELSRRKTKFEDDRWEAILSIYTTDTIDSMRFLYHHASKTLKEPFLECKRCHVAALNLITEMIKNDVQLHVLIANDDLSSTLNRLMIQFPTHSFMLNAIHEFVNAAFTSIEISNNIVPHFIPTCIGFIKIETIRPCIAICFRILDSAYQRSLVNDQFNGLLSKIPDFHSLALKALKNYKQLEESKYG